MDSTKIIKGIFHAKLFFKRKKKKLLYIQQNNILKCYMKYMHIIWAVSENKFPNVLSKNITLSCLEFISCHKFCIKSFFWRNKNQQEYNYTMLLSIYSLLLLLSSSLLLSKMRIIFSWIEIQYFVRQMFWLL